MPQWLGSEGFDVAIPGALEQLHPSTHTQNPGLLPGRPGMKAKSLQQMLQSFQPGKSEGLHLRAQILRWLLEGKKQIKLMEDAFRAHMACRSGKPALNKGCCQAFGFPLFISWREKK